MAFSQPIRVPALLAAVCLACLPNFAQKKQKKQKNLSQAEKREQERQPERALPKQDGDCESHHADDHPLRRTSP